MCNVLIDLMISTHTSSRRNIAQGERGGPSPSIDVPAASTKTALPTKTLTFSGERLDDSVTQKQSHVTREKTRSGADD